MKWKPKIILSLDLISNHLASRTYQVLVVICKSRQLQFKEGTVYFDSQIENAVYHIRKAMDAEA